MYLNNKINLNIIQTKIGYFLLHPHLSLSKYILVVLTSMKIVNLITTKKFLFIRNLKTLRNN